MAQITPSFPKDTQPIGVYIHIPFCISRCFYCGFDTRPYDPALEADYTAAVRREMKLWARLGSQRGLGSGFEVDTIYFGGGTPSLFHAARFRELLVASRIYFKTLDPLEVTIEVNPSTEGRNSFAELREMGINRVSLGVQSMQDEELRSMGRIHSVRNAVDTYSQIRSAGFDNVSIDLIAGYPGQTLDSISATLEAALALEPDHISIYLLEVKSNTLLRKKIDLGLSPSLDDDLAADMYEMICDRSHAAGYEHYEISNFARPGHRSRHNLKYWQDTPYLGLGSGSHGMTGLTRYANPPEPKDYIVESAFGSVPMGSVTPLSPETRFKDALIMGLRLVEGVDLRKLGRRYGIAASEYVRETVGDLFEAGLLTQTDDRIALTPQGRLLSNVVFSRWV